MVLQAIGGSTNGLIHLTAIANRTEHRIDLEGFDELGREVPVLIDLKPSGEHYMEHFHHAGGLPKLMAQLGDLIDLDAKTVTGASCAMSSPPPRRCRGRMRSARAQSDQARRRDGGAAWQPRPARRRDQAFGGQPELLRHTGRAVVFESIEDMTLGSTIPISTSTPTTCVLRNAGPKGAPGMPEAGYLPIPKKLGARASRTWCGSRTRA